MAPLAASLAALLLLHPSGATNNEAPVSRKLQTGVTIGGAVYYDVNGNSNRDAAEPGVPNATVQIRDCSNGRMGSARTNALGEFSYALAEPGCYYARLDALSWTFSPVVEGGQDVDPITGRTPEATLADGEAAYFFAGVVPPEDSGVATTPPAPAATPAPTREPTPNPTAERPTTPDSGAPTPCIITDSYEETLLGSAPIMRNSFGMLFGLSTPSVGELGVTPPDPDADVRITSFSLRTVSPLTSRASSTNYKVYYRPGDITTRGDLTGWTLVAEGNSLGEDKPDEETRRLRGERGLQYEQTHEPLVPDEDFDSGVVPSDIDDYAPRPSSMLADGGMETLNYDSKAVKTYLYQIPRSKFAPVDMPKYGGKASFYVTLDRSLLQYGDAGDDKFDDLDVQNGEYDPADEYDTNVRLHVGEGVTSFPWATNAAFYSPRRFLGKVWYDQERTTPCDLHETAPSGAPSLMVVPPMPLPEDAAGEDVATTFVLSVFLQKPIAEVQRMNAEVLRAFEPAVRDFLNEEYVLGHCVWGNDLDVTFQKLSLLQGVQRQLRARGERDLQSSDITILQAEMLIEGKAYADDPGVCPAGAIPARATTAGEDWDETLASIGVGFLNENVDRLGNRLRAAHPYFDDLFAVAADPDLIDRSTVDENGVAAPAPAPSGEEEDGGGVPLVPIVAAVAGVVVVLLIVGFYCYYKRSTRGETGRRPKDEELGKAGSGNSKETADAAQDVDGVVPVEKAPDAEADTLSPYDEETDYLGRCWPSIQGVPELEDVIMAGKLPRRRSETCMKTILPDPPILKRSRSIGCLREIWINLNKDMASDANGSYFDSMVNGTLYPIDDPDLLYFEREQQIMGEDLATPYVQHGADIMDSYIDEMDMVRTVRPPAPKPGKRSSTGSAAGAGEPAPEIQAPKKVNPLVLQQVEMLEAKWKQLREEYDDDENSDEDDALDGFDVNDRIEQLMGRIETLELERKMRLAELKRQEEEEEELARKRMVRAGEGINYEQEFKKEFVIRKKKKKKAVAEEEEESEESSSSEEEESDGEYDVKWMRLKVPLAGQDPAAMKAMVEKGEKM